MRVAAIRLSCWLGMAMPPGVGAAPSVEVASPQQAYQRVRVTTQGRGRPQKDVKVAVYRYRLGSGDEPRPVLSLTSDDRGRLFIGVLPLGRYHRIASAGPNLRADLYLNMLKKSGKDESSFLMELSESSYPTLEQRWVAAEQLPVKDRVRAFNGSVYDLSGAAIPGVSIEVARKGTAGQRPVLRIKSGPDGEFSAQLSAGTYIARFSMPGFAMVFVPLEVTGLGSESLRVTLPLANMTETVAGSRTQHPYKPG